MALSLLLTACGLGPAGLPREAPAPTVTVERQLTTRHGAEVRAVVEHFEGNWMSLETYREPARQQQLATGRYLDYHSLADILKANADGSSTWLVTQSALVTSLRVLSYDRERFRAAACFIEEHYEYNPADASQRHPAAARDLPRYGFVSSEGAWKLAGLFDMRFVTDWDREPSWHREIVGELPLEFEWPHPDNP